MLAGVCTPFSCLPLFARVLPSLARHDPFLGQILAFLRFGPSRSAMSSISRPELTASEMDLLGMSLVLPRIIGHAAASDAINPSPRFLYLGAESISNSCLTPCVIPSWHGGWHWCPIQAKLTMASCVGQSVRFIPQVIMVVIASTCQSTGIEMWIPNFWSNFSKVLKLSQTCFRASKRRLGST